MWYLRLLEWSCDHSLGPNRLLNRLYLRILLCQLHHRPILQPIHSLVLELPSILHILLLVTHWLDRRCCSSRLLYRFCCQYLLLMCFKLILWLELSTMQKLPQWLQHLQTNQWNRCNYFIPQGMVDWSIQLHLLCPLQYRLILESLDLTMHLLPIILHIMCLH